MMRILIKKNILFFLVLNSFIMVFPVEVKGDIPIILDEKPTFILASTEVNSGDSLGIFVYSPRENGLYCYWELYCDGKLIRRGGFMGKKASLILIGNNMLKDGYHTILLLAYDKKKQPVLFQREKVKVINLDKYHNALLVIKFMLSAIFAYILFYLQEVSKKRIEENNERESLINQIGLYADKLLENIQGGKKSKIKMPLFVEYPYESKWSKILNEQDIVLLIDKVKNITGQWEANLLEKNEAVKVLQSCQNDIENLKKSGIKKFGIKNKIYTVSERVRWPQGRS
jgi:hypothetical protein